MKNKNLKYALFAIAALGITAITIACSTKKGKMSSKVVVVQNFDVNRYVGQWYEIARQDFKHEKDLKNVTANYSKRDDGKIAVVNKGYNYVKNEWEEAHGKAKFNGPENKGALKVSFFGPFYSEYNIVMMDPAYETALIFGESTDYIWILSRNKTIPEVTKQKFVAYAKEQGYDIKRLVWTIQD